jgi:hypothetical protein
MSELNGTILFNASKNCIVDHFRLLETLNSYKWSLSRKKDWVLDNFSKKLTINRSFNIFHPTLLAEKITGYSYFNENDEIIEVDNTSIDYLYSINEIYTNDFNLNELTNELRRCFINGYIEFDMTSSSEDNKILIQNLIIYKHAPSVLTNKRSEVGQGLYVYQEKSTN